MAAPEGGVEIPWPLTTQPGDSPPEDRGRLINVYTEPLGTDQVLWRRAPGSTYFGQQTVAANWSWWGLELEWFSGAQVSLLPTGIFRGGIFVNNLLYAVIGPTVYTITSNGTATKIGTISGTDKVFFARNNNSPVPDIICVSQAGVFTLTSSSVSGYTDPNVGAPSCVVGHRGYIIFGYGNCNMLSTNINTQTINVLNLARTEANPTGVVQMISYQGQLYVFGLATVEIWGDPVNPAGFPLTRVSYNITPGIANDHAVAGWEPEFGQAPIYVGQDNTVRWLVGDTPVDITPPQLKRFIQRTGVLPLEALVYNVDGIPFCEVSGPYPPNPTFTWVFDCVAGASEDPTDAWHERASYLQTRSRFTGSVAAFGTWLCGDLLQSGYMQQVTFASTSEGPNPLIAELHSMPVEQFPSYMSCPRADFDFTMGVGQATGHQPDQTNPQVDIYYSDDSSQTWKGPRLVNLGPQSKTKIRASLWRTGMSAAQGRRWRIIMPNITRFGFAGGTMKALPAPY